MNRNLITAVVESLQDLRPDKADELFDYMLNRRDVAASYAEFDKVDPCVMFIFPDGRLLGDGNADVDVEIDEETHLVNYVAVSRQGAHHDLLSFDKDNLKWIGDTYVGHPVVSPYLAKYYNLIIVSSGHSLYNVYIPEGVEPTPEQKSRLSEFREAGYYVEDLNFSQD